MEFLCSLGQQRVSLLPFAIVFWNSKAKEEPGGCAPRLRCAGHVWIVRSATSIQSVLIDQDSALPPQDPRPLRASPSVEECTCNLVIMLFLCKSHRKGGPPVTGRLIKLRRYWMSQKSGKGDALRKEQAFLHTFVAGQKYGVRQYGNCGGDL